MLGTYEPNVQCRGTFGPEWSSCRDVLGDMPAGKTQMIFGPRSAPEVEQGLPIYIDSCELRIIIIVIDHVGNFFLAVWALTAGVETGSG